MYLLAADRAVGTKNHSIPTSLGRIVVALEDKSEG
jgi:hypothetical protein